MRGILVKNVISVVGIIMLFFVMMSSFVFFYQKAISKGIPVIVSEHQFQTDYFEGFVNNNN